MAGRSESSAIKKGEIRSISSLLQSLTERIRGGQRYLAAFAFCVTVDAIRKAQGKMMQEELPVGSI
jgi:hypothetical protein